MEGFQNSNVPELKLEKALTSLLCKGKYSFLVNNDPLNFSCVLIIHLQNIFWAHLGKALVLWAVSKVLVIKDTQTRQDWEAYSRAMLIRLPYSQAASLNLTGISGMKRSNENRLSFIIQLCSLDLICKQTKRTECILKILTCILFWNVCI